MKRLEKTKIHVKSELEVTIKASDSKNIKLVSVMKETEFIIPNIAVKQQKFQ